MSWSPEEVVRMRRCAPHLVIALELGDGTPVLWESQREVIVESAAGISVPDEIPVLLDGREAWRYARAGRIRTDGNVAFVTVTEKRDVGST